ncbi:DUF401 family protein [Chloroflexota bacterium]
MLSPSLALLISIAAILILLGLKILPGLAIFTGSLIVSLLVLTPHSIPSLMLQSLLDLQTLRLLVVIASALTLSSLMEEKGLLAKLATTTESISPRLALHFIPALIGLVPMPAGALVSATASRGLVKRIGLTPEQSTFINYWFRHIWEFSIPLYPAVILTSVVLSIPLFSVVKTLSPMTALAITSGAVLSYKILKNTPKIKGEPAKNIAYNLLRASWPILLLVLLILLGIEPMIAFPLILILLAGQQRAKWPELKKALKYGLNPKILFFLYAIMMYKATIESSGAAGVLISDMQALGLPVLVILIILPSLMGLASGYSMAFAGVALPLLVPYIVSGSGFNSHALLLAYVSGMMGLLLSPLHLCLILSAEYFKANLAKVYKYILPPAIVIEAITILVYYIGS